MKSTENLFDLFIFPFWYEAVMTGKLAAPDIQDP
jgi:hypothetical protein